MVDPVRIFVGTPANNEDLECQCVLAHSINEHATIDVEFTWMMLSRDPASFWFSDPQRNQGWKPQSWATPFSALRWAIPEACGFRGRAIYMDSDQIAMADIRELWEQPIPNGKILLAAPDGASCVMLFDNAACKGVLPTREQHWRDANLYRHVRGDAMARSAIYKGDWNCRDGKVSGRGSERYKSIYDPNVKIVHYTHIPTQPNHRHARARLKAEGKPHWYPGPDEAHPREEIQMLFDQCLRDAIKDGEGPETFRSTVEFGDYGRPRAGMTVFRVGMKVVCIADDWKQWSGAEWTPTVDKIVVRGGVYQITELNYSEMFDQLFLRLAENPLEFYQAKVFRPVAERKTDISIFTDICDRQTRTVKEKA